LSTLVGQTWLNGNLVFYNIIDGTPILTINSLTNKVECNIDGKNGISDLKYLSFDTTPETIPSIAGSIYWDDQDQTLSVVMDGGTVKLQLGQEMYIRAVNKTGSTITNGSIVYISGAQGNRPTIALADANSYANSSKVIGVVTADIDNNAYGYVTTVGLVRDLDTHTFSEGDCVYLSETAGQYTATPPSDGIARIKVGMIVKSHNTDGWLCVKVDEEKYMFGDVDNGDYSYFEGDGTYVSKGNAITYRDEYVGGAYFVPSGANAPDEVNVTIGGVSTKKYSFDGVTTLEKLGNTFEIAHDVALAQVNAGTLHIELHIHFAPSDNVTTGTAKFTVDWALIKAQGAPVAGTQVSITKAITTNKQYHNLIEGVNLPVPTGNFDVGDLIEFTISRNPADSGDTYGADIIFYKTALHVPIDMLGSRQPYIK
jgi:hypothetical protein